jgi:hypothetical protein
MIVCVCGNKKEVKKGGKEIFVKNPFALIGEGFHLWNPAFAT